MNNRHVSVPFINNHQLFDYFNMTILIYKHTSPSGKSYIGQSRHLLQRESQHRSIGSPCKAFSNAIQKYGWDSFAHEILACCTDQRGADLTESTLIVDHCTLYPAGYNLKIQGVGTAIFSEETKSKRAASMKQRYVDDPELREKRRTSRLGRKHSPETIEKLRTKRISEEHKQKISRVQRERIRSPLSLDHRRKLSAAKMGRQLSTATRAKISETKRGVPGHLQTDETKRTISDTMSGIRQGFKWFHNPTTKERKMFDTSCVPQGWYLGIGPRSR